MVSVDVCRALVGWIGLLDFAVAQKHNGECRTDSGPEKRWEGEEGKSQIGKGHRPEVVLSEKEWGEAIAPQQSYSVAVSACMQQMHVGT